jgi:8-oxo-dGTP diphosphatase
MRTRKLDLVVASYIIRNNKLLLIHHGKLDKWLPVGGHIDPNETPDEAVIREVKEETALDILLYGIPTSKSSSMETLARPFYVNVHSVGDHDHCCFYYLSTIKDETTLAINHELKDYRWFSKEELYEKIVPQDVRDIGLRAFQLYEKCNH